MENRLNHLSMRFQKKGFMLIEIPMLVKDVFDVLSNGEHCTITAVNQELEDLGWGIESMDNFTYNLANSLVQ
jgi:hypothetical protein